MTGGAQAKRAFEDARQTRRAASIVAMSILFIGIIIRVHAIQSLSAALQGKPDTVRIIYELAGRPSLEQWTLAGPRTR